jgi:cytochrome oxidase Cu insertion factor (SCO1/SenC/PrrC family)
MATSGAADSLTPPLGLSAPAQPTPIPTFSLVDSNGTTVRSADLQGKVVLVRFWATW